jgi:hypothetical protein
MDWPPLWFDNLVGWFQGIGDWFSSISLPDLSGWFPNLDLSPMGIAMGIFTTLVMLISLFPKNHASAMYNLPFISRLLCVILIFPIAYFITSKMVDR